MASLRAPEVHLSSATHPTFFPVETKAEQARQGVVQMHPAVSCVQSQRSSLTI